MRTDPVEAYGVQASDAPIEIAPDRPGLKRLWIEDDDDGQPIPMQDAVQRPALPDAILNPSERELALAGPRKPKPPAFLWTAGTYSFAFRPSAWTRLAGLTAGIAVCAMLLRPITAANKSAQARTLTAPRWLFTIALRRTDSSAGRASD